MKYPNPLAERQVERERMQDVVLLIEHLVVSQEATFKLIIDCLYDVGSASLINQKIKSRSMGRLIKIIASTSKPVFRLIAFYWVTKNCPKLVTNWLYQKVTFGQRDISQLGYSREVVAQALEKYEEEKREQIQRQQESSGFERSDFNQSGLELKRLQGQVRMLRGMLAIMILALGGVVWMLYDTRSTEWSRDTSSVESVIIRGVR